MKKYFYSDIIEIDSLRISLNELDLQEKEKKHLVSLAHENIHLTIVDTILEKLSPEDKKIFLSYLHEENHENTLEFLNKKIENIEHLLKDVSTLVISSLVNDIVKLKQK